MASRSCLFILTVPSKRAFSPWNDEARRGRRLAAAVDVVQRLRRPHELGPGDPGEVGGARPRLR